MSQFIYQRRLTRPPGAPDLERRTRARLWKRLLLSLLFALAWGTALFLPVVQSQKAQARPAKVLAGEMAADVRATDAGSRRHASLEKSGTAPQALGRRLILKLGERRVYVYEGDKVAAKYPVAIGKKGWETPTGNFQVIALVRHPRWENPWTGKISDSGPQNPLGERWIGFWTDGKVSIGFHGTGGEHLIGRAVSHGCVRMRNADIKAMFDMVELGTPVVVQP
jgi:L,D-transpeptidase ErfK/SrfK